MSTVSYIEIFFNSFCCAFRYITEFGSFSDGSTCLQFFDKLLVLKSSFFFGHAGTYRATKLATCLDVSLTTTVESELDVLSFQFGTGG